MQYDIIPSMGKNNKIDKHYSLINSRYKLSIVEQKLVLSIISLIRPTDTDFMNYQIPISQFEFITGNKNHQRLRKHCKDLMSKPLEIYTEEDDWVIFNWFSHIRLKNGMVDCAISPELKPYLLELKSHFKSYDLKYILNFQSEYSIRFYEILKKHEKIGYVILNLEELYDLFQVPKSYMNYKDFRVRVIQPASIEIAKYTDIYFEFKEIKVARKVVQIQCIIKPNKHNLVDEPHREFNLWRKYIIDKYEDRNIFFHPQLERNLRIENGLLTVAESGKIIKKETALQLWNYLYENKDNLLPLED